MLYRIVNAIAHANHSVTVTWSDGVAGDVDLSPVIAKGNVFAPMADATYFVENMRIAPDAPAGSNQTEKHRHRTIDRHQGRIVHSANHSANTFSSWRLRLVDLNL